MGRHKPISCPNEFVKLTKVNNKTMNSCPKSQTNLERSIYNSNEPWTILCKIVRHVIFFYYLIIFMQYLTVIFFRNTGQTGNRFVNILSKIIRISYLKNYVELMRGALLEGWDLVSPVPICRMVGPRPGYCPMPVCPHGPTQRTQTRSRHGLLHSLLAQQHETVSRETYLTFRTIFWIKNISLLPKI